MISFIILPFCAAICKEDDHEVPMMRFQDYLPYSAFIITSGGHVNKAIILSDHFRKNLRLSHFQWWFRI